MSASLLAVAWLAALGLAGIAALSRAAPWLDALERTAYGAPLGIVSGSLALLAIAWRTGLTLPVVLGVGVAAALLALALRPWRSAAVGLEQRSSASEGSAAVVAFLVIAILALRWAFLMSSAWTLDDHGLWAGHAYLWGDWSFHLGDTASFAYGDNFPPVHPRYAGLPFSYHYLTSLTAAAMIRLGMEPLAAMALQSFALQVLVALGILAFARRLTGRWGAGALALILFLVGGGWGGWWTVAEALRSHDVIAALRQRPWDRAVQDAHNLRWLNVYYAYLLPQRSTLYGFPLGMLALSSLHHGATRRERTAFVVAGVVAGLLPFANLGALLALVMITPFLALLLPARGWIGFFLAWVALAAPQLLLQQGGAPSPLRAFRIQVGWIAGRDPWGWFWLKNLGLFAPLLIAALASPRVVGARERRFLWAFMPVFAFANLAVFQPWDWDNTKVLVWWYLGSCVLAAAWLARAWRERRGPVARGAVGLALASLLLSGLLVDLSQGLGRDRHLFLTRDELELARQVRERTPARSLFVVALQNNHPVPVMTGRRVLMSYPGWTWAQGVRSAEREQEVHRILGLAPDAERLMRSDHVDFVAVGPVERESFGADTAAWAARFPRAIATRTYQVFDVRRLRAGSAGAPAP